MAIKAIVFDLFNTLVFINKNNQFFIKIYKESENGFGLKISEYLNLIMINQINDVFRLLGDEFQRLYSEKKELLQIEIDSVKAFEETIIVLEELSKSFDLYLISNLASPYKEVTKNLGLEKYFTKAIYSCDVGFQKPDHNIFYEVEKNSGLNKNQILMIGDSFKSDIKGAKLMGWNFIRICRQKESFGDSEIKDLKNIILYIAKAKIN